MTIAEQLTRAKNDIDAVYQKGFTDGSATGIDTSDATATANRIVYPYTAYVKGAKVTGAMPNKGNVFEYLTIENPSYTIPEGYHNGGGEISILPEAKTVTPDVTEQIITPSFSNRVLSSVTVGPIPNQRTDTSVFADGPKVTVRAGYYANDVEQSVHTVKRAETTISIDATDEDTLCVYAANNQVEGYVEETYIGEGNKTAIKYLSLTASGPTVTASDGSKSISKSVATATQATPTILIGDDGLITASATQSAGYVSAGTKSATRQLITEGGTTITPSTLSKKAATKGSYITDTIFVAGDANLVAGNIKKGVNIFGVAGSLDMDAEYDSGYEIGYDEGYREGYHFGQTEGLEALGVLCDWQITTDSESSPVITIANYHPTYYLHCRVIEYYLHDIDDIVELVIPPNSDSSYTSAYEGTSYVKTTFDIEEVRWKASAT